MIVKILLTLTLFFTFLFIILFLLWMVFHKYTEDDLEGILGACAICVVMGIICGTLAIAIYLVWGV